eukprot:355265_1
MFGKNRHEATVRYLGTISVYAGEIYLQTTQVQHALPLCTLDTEDLSGRWVKAEYYKEAMPMTRAVSHVDKVYIPYHCKLDLEHNAVQTMQRLLPIMQSKRSCSQVIRFRVICLMLLVTWRKCWV